MKIWECKIGEAPEIPLGADLPMRDAVVAAYTALAGQEPKFLFSGWGGELSESERAAYEDREPMVNSNYHYGRGEVLAELSAETDLTFETIELVLDTITKVGIRPEDWKI